MITVFAGDNNFEIQRAIAKIAADFAGTPEKFDGSELELAQLPDLLLGGTLFASERLIIIRDLSANKSAWDALSDWLERVSEDVHLVLHETKPDKRTKTYKDLQKHAVFHERAQWGERDVYAAEKWVVEEAKRLGFALDKKSAQTLVNRVGMNQWQLFHALEKLSVLDAVTPETVESITEANPTENVFNLFDAALSGNSKKIHDMVAVLERTQDPYMTFGLLSGQVFQLAALASTDKSAAEIAGPIGAHPYALSKLAPHAKRLGKAGARQIVTVFADADGKMKSSATDPWILIENALIKTAS